MKAKICIFSLLILSFVSCNMDDLGNYDYTPVDELFPVKVEDITFSEPVRMLERLHYEPVFTLLEHEERYTFSWYVIAEAANAPKVLLAETKNLDLEKNPLPQGKYRIYFEVKDPALDIFVKKVAALTVTTSVVSYGWYILKDDGTDTNIDYFIQNRYTDTNPVLTKYDNILTSGSIGALSGKAVSFGFYYDKYYSIGGAVDANGAAINYEGDAWIIQTDKNTVAVTGDLARPLKSTFADNFYETPEIINPQGIFIHPSNMADEGSSWLLNNNKLYSVYKMIRNVGKFSDRSLNKSTNLHPEIIWTEQSVFVYDKTTADFYYVAAYSGSMNKFDLDLTITENINLIKNKEVEPVRLLSNIPAMNDFKTAAGIALLKHKTVANTYYIAKISCPVNPDNPFVYIKPLPAETDLLNPAITVMATSPVVTAAVYYAKNEHELWVYTDNDLPVNQRQSQILSYPSDEHIVSIRAITPTVGISWVCVLTNTDKETYNLYVYDTQGANTALETPERLKISGNGNAKAFSERFIN